MIIMNQQNQLQIDKRERVRTDLKSSLKDKFQARDCNQARQKVESK